MKNKFRAMLMLLLMSVMIVGMTMTASAKGTGSTGKKLIKKSSIQTMALWRYGKKQGWESTWTEKKIKGPAYETVIKFVNKKYNMTIRQVVRMKGKKAKAYYYQGKTKVSYSGVKRVLKKYKD